MSPDTPYLTAKEFTESDGTADWRVLGRTAAAWFVTDSHSASAMLARYMDESRSIPTATSFRTMAVTTLDVSPGMLTRIAVVEPPYCAP